MTVRNWWKKQPNRNKITIIIFGIVILGAFFPPTGNFWTTITGSIFNMITEPIFNGIAARAVTTGGCIDVRDGSLENYNAWKATIGEITCTP